MVKQNYIREYRSSATDGIRRKYYSLTDKGNKFLDKNRTEWNQSKELIDDLIETPSEKVKKELPKAHSVDSDFESFKMLATDIGDFKVSSSDGSVSEDYLAAIGEEVLNELNQTISENESSSFENPLSDTESASETDNTNVKSDENADKSTDIENNYEMSDDSVVADEEISEVELSLIFNDKSTEEQYEYEQTENFQDNNKNPSIEKAESPLLTPSENNYEKKDEEITVQNEKIIDPIYDDFLYSDEEQPVQREYKSILNRLFPKEEYEKNIEQDTLKPSDEPDQKQISVEDIKSDKVEDNNTQRRQTYVEEYEPNNSVGILEDDLDGETEPSGTIDFSDLYLMAKKEGFKIKTSYATNKFNGEKILINKLRCDASLLFYLIAFVEMFILAFSFNPLLNFSTAFLIGAPIVVFILPLVFLIMRIIDGEATVPSVSPFRNAMEVVLIVTFQLLIIILGVALFISVDFNNYKELVTYIILPSVVAINVPVYFMIKYALLNTGKYFKK